MQQSISCLATDRLCIEYNQVELNKPLQVFWPVGLVPEISDHSKLRIFMYQSDLLRHPQADPCNIEGLNALNSWTPLVISTKNPDFPLLKSTYISIPASQEILSAISTENNFFLQIKSVDNQLCSIGPYSIPNPFTSFNIKMSSDGSIRDSTVPTEVPNNNTPENSESRSLSNRTDLQIGLGVCLGILVLLIILVAWVLRRKVKVNERNLKEKQFREDISNLSITLGKEFAFSTDNLIPKEFIKAPQDRHQVIILENSTESGSGSCTI